MWRVPQKIIRKLRVKFGKMLIKYKKLWNNSVKIWKFYKNWEETGKMCKISGKVTKEESYFKTQYLQKYEIEKIAKMCLIVFYYT